MTLDSARMVATWPVAATQYAMVYESNPHPILRVNKGAREDSSDRERRASFGSVTRSHYASEHFLTRYLALIICLASAPETYGFIAKYARATKRSPEEKI